MTGGWTIHEAAEELYPPMTEKRLRSLVEAFEYEPIGHRSAGRGRPVPEYNRGDLMRAHAAIFAIKDGLLLGVIYPPSLAG